MNAWGDFKMITRWMRLGIYFLVIVGLLISGLSTHLQQAYSINQAGLLALQGTFIRLSALPQAREQLNAAAQTDCRSWWLAGQISHSPLERQQDRAAFLVCTPQALGLVMAAAPQDRKLAEQAVAAYPTLSAAWFWLADIEKPGNPVLATSLYERVVQLNPHHGLSWCRLGTLNEQAGRLQQAELNYLQCCENGDPGSNGCYGAGRILEKTGDLRGAIQVYRLSHWKGALDRANEIERNTNQ